MTGQDYTIARQLRERLSESIPLVDFRVFGSRARGAADEHSEDAQKMLSVGLSPRSITNRAYYAIFYAVLALFLKTDRHARRRMKWRRITEEEVYSVLEHPDKAEQSIGGRTNVYKLIRERYIKVTYKEFSDQTLIISAVDKGTGGQER